MRIEFTRDCRGEFTADEWACPHQAAFEIIASDWRRQQTPPYEDALIPISGKPGLVLDYNLR